jgi:hypothetical protein
MDLSPECVREALHLIDLDGWGSAAGEELLEHVRRTVVLPVVRRSGLRGPAADQAEASGWEAGWDSLRRPTARTAQNPGGMVWMAVRRAVAAEVAFTRMRGDGPPPGGPGQELSSVSLDALMEDGWQPVEGSSRPVEGPGPTVAAVLDGLVAAGWDRADAADSIAIMAEFAMPARSAARPRPAAPAPSGPPTTRWRWVSLRLGVPEWQARRLAGLLLGGEDWPGVLELVVTHGSWVMKDPVVRSAMRSTTVRWSVGPGAWLVGWDTPLMETA